MTTIELLEAKMTTEQVKIMRDLWDALRWSSFDNLDKVKTDLRNTAVQAVKDLVYTSHADAIQKCRACGAAILWIEEMERHRR